MKQMPIPFSVRNLPKGTRMQFIMQDPPEGWKIVTRLSKVHVIAEKVADPEPKT